MLSRKTAVVLPLLRLTPGALGLYGRAYTIIVMPANLFGRVLDAVLFPALAKVQSDGSRLTMAYRRGVAAVAMMSLPISGMTIVLADDVVAILPAAGLVAAGVAFAAQAGWSALGVVHPRPALGSAALASVRAALLVRLLPSVFLGPDGRSVLQLLRRCLPRPLARVVDLVAPRSSQAIEAEGA